jgi:hypothetical protein
MLSLMCVWTDPLRLLERTSTLSVLCFADAQRSYNTLYNDNPQPNEVGARMQSVHFTFTMLILLKLPSALRAWQRGDAVRVMRC